MDQDQLEACRRSPRAREQRRRAALEDRRQAALAAARQAAPALLRLGARQVLLFGSILSPHRFHERSDLDLVVYGLPDRLWAKALGTLEDWPGLGEVEIDLKPAEDLPAEFLSFIEEQGELVTP
ncbi:MAG: nucleotidyltransferase domain-containing protein [Thermodesulfobacteriota bacterium]